MHNKVSNNKRLAKNTLLLYIRMMVTTFVSLFTARLTLRLLGVEDYGISNVVGGIVGFTGIIKGTMSSATHRFLAYDLGKGDVKKYQKTFSMLVNIFVCVGLVGIIILEIVGPWFIETKLTIPESRMFAAQCIFQFSIVSFSLNLIIIPHTSSIISYEKMDIFAYFTFLDIAMKLIIVYALYVTPIDRLITLSSLNLLSTVLHNVINVYYCRKYLPGCIYVKFWDVRMFKHMSSYAGWNLLGSTSWVMNTQGQAVLINMFFGPAVNGAKAVADRINVIVSSFSTNFFMALNPQIIKSYASGNIEYTRQLVLKGSKFTFFLMAILSIPLMFNMKLLLRLWLGADQISNEMVIFSILVLVFTMINSLETPLTQAIRANGNIKKYQIVVGIQTLMFIPIAWLFYRLGLPSFSSMIVLCSVYTIVTFTRVYLVGPIINLTIKDYIFNVIIPIVLVLSIGIFFCFCLPRLFFNEWVELAYRFFSDLIVVSFICYIIGMTKNERAYIHIGVRKLWKKRLS